MSIELCLRGPGATAVEGKAVDLLRLLGGDALLRRVETPETGQERGLAERVAVATLVLTLPGALNDTLSLAERLKVSEAVAWLVAEVRATGTSATLRCPGSPPLDLSHTPTDTVMDHLLPLPPPSP